MSDLEFFADRTVAIATMHHKEQAIAPLLDPLGIKTVVPENFNTDRFGTFTREVPRSGSQIEAARRKALAAIEQTGLDLAIASEGSFTPHPAFAMLPCNRELVVLIDTLHDLEIVGECVSTDTNFNHCSVSNIDQAVTFANKVKFPSHALVVMTSQTATDTTDIIKGITDYDRLHEAVNVALARSTSGKIHLETDMRAMHNPTRMKTISEATRDLIQKMRSRCPNCLTPGFAVVDRIPGLPCELCGSPTNSTLADRYACNRCGFQQEKRYPNNVQAANPAYCSYCNP